MPADPPLTYGDYLKAAFTRRYPIKGLGEMPLNQLALGAFAVLGLANPGFLLLGAALEITYLLGLSSSERFQKLVRAERMMRGRERSDAALQRAINGLTPASQRRYARLLAQAREIAEPALRLDDSGRPVKLEEVRTGGLSKLVWIFLRLLLSREAVEETLARVDRSRVEAEIEKLEAQLAETADDSPLVRSLRGTLEIQQRRLANLERAEQSRSVIEAELERIERQVALIREEAALSNRPEMLSDHLESVSVTLNETNRWMEQHAEIFGSLGAGGLGDPLAVDPLAASPEDLPEIPDLPEVETKGKRER